MGATETLLIQPSTQYLYASKLLYALSCCCVYWARSSYKIVEHDVGIFHIWPMLPVQAWTTAAAGCGIDRDVRIFDISSSSVW